MNTLNGSQYANTIFPSGILKANPFAVISRNIYYRFGLQLHSSIIAQSLRHRLEFDLKSKLKSLPHPILWVMESMIISINLVYLI